MSKIIKACSFPERKDCSYCHHSHQCYEHALSLVEAALQTAERKLKLAVEGAEFDKIALNASFEVNKKLRETILKYPEWKYIGGGESKCPVCYGGYKGFGPHPDYPFEGHRDGCERVALTTLEESNDD